MLIILSLLSIVVSLLLVVGIHEAGHAWMARVFDVNVKRISIGFGRPLFRWQRNNCEWVWAIWPLGGYAQLLNSRIEPVPPKDNKFCFDKKPVWVRCIILLAGAFANILTAWLALVFMLMLGYQQRSPVIANVTSPSMAATAGVAAGDRIISFAGQKVPSWREVGMQLIMTMDQRHVDVVVENPAGVKRPLSLDLAHGQFTGGKGSLLNIMGITADLSKQNIQKVPGAPFLQSCEQAFLQIIGLFYFFLIMLKQLLTGVIPFAALLGPFGLFTVMASSFLQGLAVFLYFIATLSLAVALVNLFPLPGLDGGSIVYALVEKVRGKPVSIGMEVLLHRLMFIVFCLVLVQLILNDAQRYFN